MEIKNSFEIDSPPTHLSAGKTEVDVFFAQTNHPRANSYPARLLQNLLKFIQLPYQNVSTEIILKTPRPWEFL